MTPRRRRLLLGAGAVAASAGAGLGVWLGREDGPVRHSVFGRRFPTPAGADLDMATFLGRPLLLNFWATWCPPCVREMPLLDRFHRAHAAQGWQVVGLAIDRPAAVREFLQRSAVSFPIGLAGFDGTNLAKDLGNTAGGLPFSALFDARGELRDRHLGELQETDLLRWVDSI